MPPQSADQRRGPSRGPFGDVRRDRPGNADPDAVVFDVGDLPDLTPLAGWALGGMGLLVALVIGGSVSGAWETVLLWANRVPFSATATVTDPIFNRDISFFLFELPFLRLVQGVFNGLVIASLLIALARYLIGATSGGLVFATPVRVHLGVLGGLFLLSVAFGYQLDKLELVYSTRGIATGVSFTDQNAQFAAFDILTFISGIAAALLVGGAFTRSLWPLGLTISVWFLASLAVGRIYPEAVQRFTVEPNQFAQEERYIGNNIAMTRLAFGLDSLDRPGVQRQCDPDPGGHRARIGHVPERPPVGLPPAQRHDRPAAADPALLHVHRRRYGPLRDRWRRAPGHALRSRTRHRAEPDGRRLGQ